MIENNQISESQMLLEETTLQILSRWSYPQLSDSWGWKDLSADGRCHVTGLKSLGVLHNGAVRKCFTEVINISTQTGSVKQQI